MNLRQYRCWIKRVLLWIFSLITFRDNKLEQFQIHFIIHSTNSRNNYHLYTGRVEVRPGTGHRCPDVEQMSSSIVSLALALGGGWRHAPATLPLGTSLQCACQTFIFSKKVHGMLVLKYSVVNQVESQVLWMKHSTKKILQYAPFNPVMNFWCVRQIP